MNHFFVLILLLTGAARADEDEGTAWADHKWVRTLYSGIICHADEEKSWAVRMIRDEQKYAQQFGGVVDVEKLYELQNRIRWMDERLKDAKAELRKRRLSKLPCSGYIRTLAMCFSLKDPESIFKRSMAACDDAETKTFVEAPRLAGMDQ